MGLDFNYLLVISVNKNFSHYHTAQTDKIKFHNDTADDPDWQVKQCYLVMIAAAEEVENGIDNLWRHGKSKGRRDYPDFEKYIPKNYFKVFSAAAPLCWAAKELWFKDKRDRPWETFLPCLQKFNDKRRRLMKAVLLMMDESMSGWRPKTTKFGGLPNYTYEPRKPTPLGTMFRNSVECISGCLVFQDVVAAAEVQRRKKFHGEESYLPNREPVGAHTAEVLRQVEGAGVEKGGWVGGNAWFGSIMTAIEVKKRFGVHSTFIIKNNRTFFPMRALKRILDARYGEHPAGHWVVLTTEMSGVKLIALAYAWSQKGVSYFISTCGSTEASREKYVSSFEDEFGNVSHKTIERPELCHFLYEYLPLIDEHNKQRQRLLALEKSWPTRSCWFRLLVTLVGMSVVDCQRLYRNYRAVKMGWTTTRLVDNEMADDLEIRKFSDKICKKLGDRTRQRAFQHQAAAARRGDEDNEGPLERIANISGDTCREPTNKQKDKGRHVGAARQQSCFICRKYLAASGDTVFRSTPWRCRHCKMPLCKRTRRGDPAGRTLDCIEEHQFSTDRDFGCFQGTHMMNKMVPLEKRVNLHPRKSGRTTRNTT